MNNSCDLCVCGESKEDDHIPDIREEGPICPGQLEDLDIYTELEKEED